MWVSARLEVLRLLVKGLTNGQIADALGIASETMRKHVSLALERTGTKTRTELVGASGPTVPGPSATAGTSCETSPVNIADTIDNARRAFERAGRGCLVRLGEDEPRYATVTEIAARLEPHPDATMLLTAVSEAVERYDPSREAAILIEVASGYQVLILGPEGYDYVGGLTFEGYGSPSAASAAGPLQRF
jgi:Bacterial regulatory proteins, luxR family